MKLASARCFAVRGFAASFANMPGSLNIFPRPIASAPSPRSSAATRGERRVRGRRTTRRTLGSLDFLVTLTDRRAILDLKTSLICLDRLDVASLTMQRRTLAHVTLGPCRVHLDTLGT